MKTTAYKPLWGLFAILVGVTAITAISKMTAGNDKIPWRSDLQLATDEAKRDGKPILLYFTAAWCGPCQRMKSETWSDLAVESKLQHYVPVKIDIDHDRTTAERYEIAAVPTFVLLDAEGNVTKRTTGLLPAQNFLAWIEG